jgi:hypothetical protein
MSPTASSCPVSLGLSFKKSALRLVMYDHVGGIIPDIDAPPICIVSRSVRHVKEAGKVTLVADQEGLKIWRAKIPNACVYCDSEQINPIGDGIPTAPGHGHELLYVDGDQVDKKGGLPKSAYIEDRQSVQFVCAPLVVLDIKSTQRSSMHTSSDGLSA